ncbi:MAG TPA: hypothetical protein PLL69_01240, partial [Gemmatimonadales bacterium]|nr:hypothetical protein [Gemmatimonadales bacterium]
MIPSQGRNRGGVRRSRESSAMIDVRAVTEVTPYAGAGHAPPAGSGVCAIVPGPGMPGPYERRTTCDFLTRRLSATTAA